MFIPPVLIVKQSFKSKLTLPVTVIGVTLIKLGIFGKGLTEINEGMFGNGVTVITEGILRSGVILIVDGINIGPILAKKFGNTIGGKLIITGSQFAVTIGKGPGVRAVGIGKVGTVVGIPASIKFPAPPILFLTIPDTTVEQF